MAAPSVYISTSAFAQESSGSTPTLKEAFKNDFRIGASINKNQFEGRDKRAEGIIPVQFNTITPESALKWGPLHPEPDRYDFSAADAYVAFGEKYKMWIVGHCLVWHAQTPDWVFEEAPGKPASREELLKRMHEHIRTVVGRYKGRIAGWDVVNEALNDDGTLRQSRWMQIIGEDYIAKAFQFAHEADPAAELYYNDFDLEIPAKRQGAIALIKKLQAQGIPVKAVGMQDHVRLEWPSISDEAATIEAFAKLGVKVNITELDVDVLPRGEERADGGCVEEHSGHARTEPLCGWAAGQRAASVGEALCRIIRRVHEASRRNYAGDFLVRDERGFLVEQLAGKRKNELSVVV